MGLTRTSVAAAFGRHFHRGRLVAVLLPLTIAAACGTPQPEGNAPTAGQEGLPESVPAYMVKGDPNAPVVLFEWSDYQCPYCARHAEETMPKIVADYVDTGKVRVVFRDLPLISIHEHAQKAAEAARCAGDLGGSDAYWDMYHQLFANQAEWSAVEDAAPSFKGYAAEVGVDQAAFDSCLDEGRLAAAVEADFQEAISLGIQATPSFVLQDTMLEGALPFEAFQEKLDIVVAGGTLPTATVPPTQEMVEVEAPSILVDVGDAPVRGNADAPVTIIEFSDYECPYCKMFFDDTFPTLVSEYIDTGRVLYAFRDLPLSTIHPVADRAAQAAHCARDQGGDDAYYAMHDALFAQQEAWSAAEDPVASFAAMADEADLDGEALAACLEAGTHAATVADSLQQATTDFQLQGTPTFVINGQMMPGVLTPEALADMVSKAERGEPITLTMPKEYALQLTPQPPQEE